MKIVLALFTFLILTPFWAHANEVDFEIYHPLTPERSLAQRPSIPKLLAPLPLVTLSKSQTKLEWNQVEGATAYAVQLSLDPIFFTLIVNEPLYKETSYSINANVLEVGQTYYWRIAAIKESNQPGTIKSLFNRSSFSVQ